MTSFVYSSKSEKRMAESTDKLTAALKRLPQPEPRPGFVDRALRAAVAQPERRSWFLTRWETWAGAALGGVFAAVVMFMLLRPTVEPPSATPVLSLAVNETRDIDVLIDSERALEGATIRIIATGSVVLAGLEDEREIGWQAHLDRGSNLLTLPVAARSAGAGKLVAVIEHEGRTRRVAIDIKGQADVKRS